MATDIPVWLPAWLGYLHARYQDALARAADAGRPLPARRAAAAEIAYFDRAIAVAETWLPVWPQVAHAPPRAIAC